MNSIDNSPVTTDVTRDYAAASALATNKVIRNTYMLLAMTLALAAVTAGISMALRRPHPRRSACRPGPRQPFRPVASRWD